MLQQQQKNIIKKNDFSYLINSLLILQIHS